MSVEISKLGIAGYRQFHETLFDFTDPRTGKPLKKVCLIGGNGTGKSTVLRVLAKSLGIEGSQFVSSEGYFGIELKHEDSLFVHLFGKGPKTAKDSLFQMALQPAWEDIQSLLNPNPFDINTGYKAYEKPVVHLSTFLENQNCIYCPADSEQSPMARTEVPQTNLDTALRALKKPKRRQVIGQQNIGQFWTNLIGAIKKREADFLIYQSEPANQERKIREVADEFFRRNPDVLRELADFWDSILEKAGLEFDYENASVPIQLSDNLKAYIRLRHSKDRVNYAELSAGIRNFIFKLGHIFTIFRGKTENRGIILVDEPENSLYPDFLFDLVGHYERAAPGAQLFMATHSPIIAAQFRPEERFILQFNDTGGVTVRRGVTPEGDDPNDVLLRDFAVRTLYGKVGLEKWKRFHELDRLIQSEEDSTKRRALMKEYMDLGKAYNFAPDEIPL